MRRAALALGLAGLIACSLSLPATAGAAPFPGATPVVGSDGAILAITANAKDVNRSLDAAVSGAKFELTGTVSIYVPGATVAVAAYLNGTLVTTQTVPIEADGTSGSGATGSSGVTGSSGASGVSGTSGVSGAAAGGGSFTVSLRVDGTGDLTVQATQAATATQELLVSDPIYVHLVSPNVHPGEKGLAVRILQAALTRGHYVVGARGIYDARTQRAVLAFRKMADMARTMVANDAVFKALAAGRGTFKVRYPKQGRHVEGDLTHQVLALIGANGKVRRLYPMSSGKPSTPTQPGNFVVWLRVPGVNNDDMVDSSFFHGGDAIHGYNPVPPYAASHGCLRVPVPDALSIYDWIAGTGVPVDVYYR